MCVCGWVGGEQAQLARRMIGEGDMEGGRVSRVLNKNCVCGCGCGWQAGTASQEDGW